MDEVPYGRILREGWLIILVVTMLGASAAWTASRLLPETYTSTSTLMLQIEASGASLAERNQFALGRIKSYPALIHSPEIIDGVRDDLELDQSEYSDRDIRSMLQADDTDDTILLTITAEAPSAELSARLANSAAEHLSDVIEDTENRQGGGDFSLTLQLMLPASTPSSPSSPEAIAITGLGGIAGLALGAIIAVYRTTTNRQLRTISDVRTASGLPVLGQVSRSRRTPADIPMLVDHQGTIDNIMALGGSGINTYVMVPASMDAVDDSLLAGLVDAHLSLGMRACVLDFRVPATRIDGAHPLEELLEQSAGSDIAHPAGGRVIYAADAAVHPRTIARIPHVIKTLREAFDAVIVVSDDRASTLLERLAGAGAGTIVPVRFKSTSAAELLASTTRLRVMGIYPIGVLMTDMPRGALEAVAETWQDSDRASRRGKAADALVAATSTAPRPEDHVSPPDKGGTIGAR